MAFSFESAIQKVREAAGSVARSPSVRVVLNSLRGGPPEEPPPWSDQIVFRDQIHDDFKLIILNTVGANLAGDEEGRQEIEQMTDALLECFDFIVVHGKSPFPLQQDTEGEMAAKVVESLEAAGAEGDIASHLGNILINAGDMSARALAWQMQRPVRDSGQERRLAVLRDSIRQTGELLLGRDLDKDALEIQHAYPRLPSMKGRGAQVSAEDGSSPIPAVGAIDVFPEHPDFIPCDGRHVFAEDYPELWKLFEAKWPDKIDDVAGKDMLRMPDLTELIIRDEEQVAEGLVDEAFEDLPTLGDVQREEEGKD